MKGIKMHVTGKLTVLMAFIGICHAQDEEVCDANMRNETCDMGLNLQLIAGRLIVGECTEAYCEYSSLEDKEKYLEPLAVIIYKSMGGFLKNCSDLFTPSELVTIYSKLVDELFETEGVNNPDNFALAYKMKQLIGSEDLPEAEKNKISKAYDKLPALYRDIADGPVCIITPTYNNEKVLTGYTYYDEVGTNRNNRELDSMEPFQINVELDKNSAAFSIKGIQRGQYWDAGVNNKVWSIYRRPIYAKAYNDTSKRFIKYQWLLQPYNNGTEMYIQNKFIYEYAYAVEGGDYNDKLRAVFLYRTLTHDITADSDFRWKVEKC